MCFAKKKKSSGCFRDYRGLKTSYLNLAAAPDERVFFPNV